MRFSVSGREHFCPFRVGGVSQSISVIYFMVS